MDLAIRNNRDLIVVKLTDILQRSSLQPSVDRDRPPNTGVAQHAPLNGLCRNFPLHRLSGRHAITSLYIMSYIAFFDYADYPTDML
jgi:hypothetical protein